MTVLLSYRNLFIDGKENNQSTSKSFRQKHNLSEEIVFTYYTRLEN